MLNVKKLFGTRRFHYKRE
ncbi:hypothetical protein AM593_08610, partial [Mytilus galloprovincialis]